MNKRKRKIAIAVVVVVLIALLGFFCSGAVGVGADSVESDARSSQHIDPAWKTSMSTSEGLCAMIFYDNTLNQYVYSIYLNRPGLSFGYFFREGGSHPRIEDGIAKVEYNEQGYALVSMNKGKVAKIEVDNGDGGTKTANVDPEKPFAVVFPMNAGAVTLYDVDGNIVPVA